MRRPYTNSNGCLDSQLSSSTGSIDIPTGSSIKAAYLYWSGSGNLDNSITLNGRSISADPANSHSLMIDIDLSSDINKRPYYSTRADVTSYITANQTQHTVSGLEFARAIGNNSNHYCSSLLAYGGWALVVIYENTSSASYQPLRVINIFDGYQQFWGGELSLTPNNFVIADNPKIKGSGKHAHITWEGDAGNSDEKNNRTETLKFEGSILEQYKNRDGNQFNSYSSGIGMGKETSGVDIDVYDISQYLNAKQTSVTTTYSTGQDMVFLTAEIISVPNEPVAELSIKQSGPTSFIRGEENSISFTVTNNGPSTAPANSEFNFAIPQGFNFVSTTNSLWECTAANNNLKCLYKNVINKGSNALLPLIFFLDNNTATDGSINLTGTIKGILFDNILSDNTTTKTYSVSGGTPPAPPITGNKWLYLDTTSNSLTRDRDSIDSVGTSSYQIIGSNNSASWTLSPAFQSAFRFNEPEINVNLCLQVTSFFRRNLPLTLQLILKSATGVNTVIAERSKQVNLPSFNNNTEQFTFSLPLENQSIDISPLDTLELKITNNITNNSGFRDIRVYSKMPNNYCYVSLPAATVINVDSITAKDNSGNPITDDVPPGSVISLEAIVSDPFGSFDINSADISATGPDENIIFSNSQMTVLNDSGAATKTFSFSYTVPSNSETGAFKFTVRAKEGVENTVEHSSDFVLLVKQSLPNIKVEKTVEVYSDPIHGTNNANNYPKAFPGAILTYTITAENTGPGVAQDDSIWLSDAVPAKTYMLVTDYNGISGQGPVINTTAGTANGLTYEFTALNSTSDDIEFSDSEGANFNYTPLPDGEGIDKNITHFRINPKGIFQAPTAGESSKQFIIKFRVQLQ